MKQKLFLFGLITTSFLMSCKKYQSGCTDTTASNFSTTAKMDDGSCTYRYTEDVTITSWTFNDSSQEALITWAEITDDVVGNGGFTMYVANGSGWVALPYTFYNSSLYSSTIGYEVTTGQVKIQWTDSDLTDPGNPGSLTFKLVVEK